MNILPVLFILIFPIVLFLPIPLKIKIKYINRQLLFQIYNLNITNKIVLGRSSPKNTAEKNRFVSLINAIKSSELKNVKARFSVKVDVKLCYGLGDAAYTALVYGAICSLKIFLFNRLNGFFHIKKYHDNIKPDFNSSRFELEITSIIYISLVKIIYVYIKLSRYKRQSKKSNNSIDSNFA